MCTHVHGGRLSWRLWLCSRRPLAYIPADTKSNAKSNDPKSDTKSNTESDTKSDTESDPRANPAVFAW